MTALFLFACVMTTGWAQAHPLWPGIFTAAVLIVAAFAWVLYREDRDADRYAVPFHTGGEPIAVEVPRLRHDPPGQDPDIVEWFSRSIEHEAWKTGTAPLPAIGDLTEIIPVRDHGDWDAPVSAPRSWIRECEDVA